MKKSFATLIKLQKTKVDDQRRHMARLMEHLNIIQRRMMLVEMIRQQEHAAAQKNDAARMTYGAFLKVLIANKRALEKDYVVAADAVRSAQEKLAELFEEQKRYEIAEDQRVEEIEKEERRLERIDLDEVGGVRHERQRTA